MTPSTHAALKILTRELGEDFHAYSRSVAERVVLARVDALKLASGQSYVELLVADPEERRILARNLRVRHSTFFRDPLQFELLKSAVLPLMVESRGGPDAMPIRAWSTACAGGEEPYSTAIVAAEVLAATEGRPGFQLFATDVSEEGLAEASTGLYAECQLENASLGRLGEFFTREGDRYRINERLKAGIHFSRYDMLDTRTYAPPECVFGTFDLILCRNFLMYLDVPAASKVFDKLYKALTPGGVLMLGTAEVPGDIHEGVWRRIFDYGCYYEKI